MHAHWSKIQKSYRLTKNWLLKVGKKDTVWGWNSWDPSVLHVSPHERLNLQYLCCPNPQKFGACCAQLALRQPHVQPYASQWSSQCNGRKLLHVRQHVSFFALIGSNLNWTNFIGRINWRLSIGWIWWIEPSHWLRLTTAEFPCCAPPKKSGPRGHERKLGRYIACSSIVAFYTVKKTSRFNNFVFNSSLVEKDGKRCFGFTVCDFFKMFICVGLVSCARVHLS